MQQINTDRHCARPRTDPHNPKRASMPPTAPNRSSKPQLSTAGPQKQVDGNALLVDTLRQQYDRYWLAHLVSMPTPASNAVPRQWMPRCRQPTYAWHTRPNWPGKTSTTSKPRSPTTSRPMRPGSRAWKPRSQPPRPSTPPCSPNVTPRLLSSVHPCSACSSSTTLYTLQVHGDSAAR